jgi:dipeptidyl-peptidase-4
MRSHRLLSLLALSLAAAVPASAQKKQYTMAEATNGIATTLAPKALKQAGWRPGTHEFYYRTPDGRLHMYNAETGDTSLERCCAGSEYGNTGYAWMQKNAGYYIKGDSMIERNWLEASSTVTGTKITKLPKGFANLQIAKANGSYAFTVDNNLYFSDGQNNAKQITFDADKNIINGQAVHRNEFGIDGGIFFSATAKYLAYYRMDQTMVEDYPVIDWSVVPAKNENVKYPMAGRRSHEVTLQVYNTKTGATTAIQTEGPKDQYLTSITWSPDEKYIYIAVLNRDQNHLWLNQYDATTGQKVKTLLQEEDKRYVEPQHPMGFLPGSSTRFIWWSQRDGYMHLWLCDMAKNGMRCLTPGNYVVNDLLGFNAAKKEVLFTSAKEDPREKHGYAVNWETGKVTRLDNEPGTHNYSASEDGQYLYDVFSSEKFAGSFVEGDSDAMDIRPDTRVVAKRCIVRSSDGVIRSVLLDAANPLADYQRPEVTEVTLAANDATKLYGKLILPTDFNPKKKYPVIVYLYNGPHVQLIKNGFPGTGNLWYEYLAQHGYIVWTMDGRGSSNRGLKFEQAVFRQLGTVEMNDQLKGVEFLKSLPYVDTARMGVHGWSFGGFMTTSLMLRHPGVFKVAVAGGPVMDWSMYEIMYGERYMDTPEQNPDGYRNNLLLDKVQNLKGKLLVIHGAQDATVVWQHSVNFVKACVDKGVQIDYFMYPGYEHNVRGKDRVHLMQKITDYFDDYLK